MGRRGVSHFEDGLANQVLRLDAVGDDRVGMEEVEFDASEQLGVGGTTAAVLIAGPDDEGKSQVVSTAGAEQVAVSLEEQFLGPTYLADGFAQIVDRGLELGHDPGVVPAICALLGENHVGEPVAVSIRDLDSVEGIAVGLHGSDVVALEAGMALVQESG